MFKNLCGKICSRRRYELGLGLPVARAVYVGLECKPVVRIEARIDVHHAHEALAQQPGGYREYKGLSSRQQGRCSYPRSARP